jgi:hypothetical protein
MRIVPFCGFAIYNRRIPPENAMHQRVGSVLAAVAFSLVAVLGAGDGLTFVPWKVMKPGQPPVAGHLILYWIPATPEEMKRSPLLTSRALAEFSMHCVGMQLVRPDDTETIHRLGASEDLPLVILTDGHGKKVGMIDSRHGLIRLAAVEAIVRDELLTRASMADTMLDEARSCVSKGERERAVGLYKQVWNQRCMTPRQARSAQRALKRLGAVK